VGVVPEGAGARKKVQEKKARESTERDTEGNKESIPIMKQNE